MKQLLAVLLLLSVLNVALPAQAAPQHPQTGISPAHQSGLMGMAIRDPWYEFGTNPNFPNQPNYTFQDNMGAALALAGVEWVRLEFHIPIGADAATVTQEIAKNDYFIREVAPRHGIKVLALLGFDLLRHSEALDLNCESASCLVPNSRFGGGVNQAMELWLTRALEIADRYRDQIGAYQILNEQNRLPPSGQAISPKIMGRLQTKFYRFCKNINPTNENHGCTNSYIIMGGLHPRGTGTLGKPGYMSDAEYLKALYNDSSFKDFYSQYGFYPNDAVAYHPYPEEIRLSISNVYVDQGLQRIRKALEEISPPKVGSQNPACVPFWITEVGYNVGFDPDGPKNPIPVQTEQGQVDFMTDIYTSLPARQLNAQRCGANQPEVAKIFWFKFEDFPPAVTRYNDKGEPVEYAQQWGVVRIPILSDGGCEGGCYDPNGRIQFYRPAFWTYRDFAKPVRLYLPVIGANGS